MAKTLDWVGFGGSVVKLLPVPVVLVHLFNEIGQKGDSPAPALQPSVQSGTVSPFVCLRQRERVFQQPHSP